MALFKVLLAFGWMNSGKAQEASVRVAGLWTEILILDLLNMMHDH